MYGKCVCCGDSTVDNDTQCDKCGLFQSCIMCEKNGPIRARIEIRYLRLDSGLTGSPSGSGVVGFCDNPQFSVQGDDMDELSNVVHEVLAMLEIKNYQLNFVECGGLGG